jgi:hypothetical protein
MSQVRWRLVAVVLSVFTVIAAAAQSGRHRPIDASPPTLPAADRYYIRVTGCDDGGRAYLNKTQVVDVGFGEDSRWLDITDDLTKKDNKIKFEVVNKTGAITYLFQVRKNNTLVYNQSCGTAGVAGCEDNRAFRLGVAREFTYTIDKVE